MTDKLTPGMLRDLANLVQNFVNRGGPFHRFHLDLETEAARREAMAPCDDPGACEVGGCLKPSLCQAAAVEDKPAHAADDLVERINAACVGHPYAKIPWPHRLLHDCRDRIEALDSQLLDIKRWAASLEEQRDELAIELKALKARVARLTETLHAIDQACTMAEVHRLVVAALAEANDAQG